MKMDFNNMSSSLPLIGSHTGHSLDRAPQAKVHMQCPAAWRKTLRREKLRNSQKRINESYPTLT